MVIKTLKFNINELEDFEQFYNELFIDLEKYKKTHSDFTFKMVIDNDELAVKTLKLYESKN